MTTCFHPLAESLFPNSASCTPPPPPVQIEVSGRRRGGGTGFGRGSGAQKRGREAGADGRTGSGPRSWGGAVWVYGLSVR